MNVSSQAGARTTDAERTNSWTYSTLKSINYPKSVILGDGSPTLGQWNNGTSLATITNWGNDNLNLQWNATNPTSGSDTWILNNTDFMIDDDTSLNSEPGSSIASVFLNQTQKTFEPASGLQVCTAYDCDNGAINETMSTYFHIYPPTGLLAGTYNSTLTIIVS